MFTGIIECIGRVVETEKSGQNLILWVESPISHELKVDQSVAHEGICLTVEKVNGNRHRITAVMETVEKTTIDQWVTGTEINLERCMSLGGRLDGHLVQGHVDCKGRCIEVREFDGSWIYRFEIDQKFGSLIVEKGSICLNGISLTIFDISPTQFSVTIIPYTYTHTTIASIRTGEFVNLEFDIIGKYVLRIEELRKPT
jgi:riboflavin synthase